MWTISPRRQSRKVVIALHGGAYSAQASIFHWWTYCAVARDTGATVLAPLYPLTHEGGTAAAVVPPITGLIAVAVDEHGAENVSVLGDSAGAGLVLAALQQLVADGTPTPCRAVLIAPWLDVTVNDPRSAAIESDDVLLDIANLRRSGVIWAGDLKTTDALVSPLFGSLDGLPHTTVFSGSLDLLTPDSVRLRERAISEGRENFSFVFAQGRIHAWPLFPVLSESDRTRPAIYAALQVLPEVSTQGSCRRGPRYDMATEQSVATAPSRTRVRCG